MKKPKLTHTPDQARTGPRTNPPQPSTLSRPDPSEVRGEVEEGGFRDMDGNATGYEPSAVPLACSVLGDPDRGWCPCAERSADVIKWATACLLPQTGPRLPDERTRTWTATTGHPMRMWLAYCICHAQCPYLRRRRGPVPIPHAHEFVVWPICSHPSSIRFESGACLPASCWLLHPISI